MHIYVTTLNKQMLEVHTHAHTKMNKDINDIIEGAYEDEIDKRRANEKRNKNKDPTSNSSEIF